MIFIIVYTIYKKAMITLTLNKLVSTKKISRYKIHNTLQ